MIKVIARKPLTPVSVIICTSIPTQVSVPIRGRSCFIVSDDILIILSFFGESAHAEGGNNKHQWQSDNRRIVRPFSSNENQSEKSKKGNNYPPPVHFLRRIRKFLKGLIHIYISSLPSKNKYCCNCKQYTGDKKGPEKPT